MGAGCGPDACHVEMSPSTYPAQPQPSSYPSEPATYPPQPQPYPQAQPYSYPSEPATYPPHTGPQPPPTLYPNLYPEANGGGMHPQSPVSYPSSNAPRVNHASM